MDRKILETIRINSGREWFDRDGYCPKGAVLRAYGYMIPFSPNRNCSNFIEYQEWLNRVISNSENWKAFNDLHSRWRSHWKKHHSSIWNALNELEDQLLGNGPIGSEEVRFKLLQLQFPEEIFDEK